MNSPLSSRLYFFTLVLCALVMASVQSFAARDEDSATGEDVAIAFFKTGETNPDFDLWAKNSKDYKVSSPARANEVLFIEKQRLIKKWKAFNLEESVLEIRGNVTVDLKVVVDKDAVEQYWMYVTFKEGGVTYFPYKFQNYLFAVIPQQIETLTIQPLQKEQYDLLHNDFKGKTGTAQLSLQLKPVKAYMQQPYMIDDKEQWALLCDIATMSLYSRTTRQILWNYGAEWYVSPVTEELRDLYQSPTEGGTTEPPPAP